MTSEPECCFAMPIEFHVLSRKHDIFRNHLEHFMETIRSPSKRSWSVSFIDKGLINVNKKLKVFRSLKWCIQGECVDDGSPMIDGGWSDWQDTQSCTQTCGGGVQWKTRSCTNPV